METDGRRLGRHNGRRAPRGGRLIAHVSEALVDLVPDDTLRDRIARAAFMAAAEAFASTNTTNAEVTGALELAGGCPA